MVETAHQLYETLSQRGAPALTMMDSIPRRMLPTLRKSIKIYTPCIIRPKQYALY